MKKVLNPNKVDLNLLKVFDLLMEERSVTRAAQRICRTQSAVSHSLNKLRDIFGDELFVNQAGAMSPTSLARELGPVISLALADLQSVVDRHIDFKPAESTRQFKVGVTDYTGALYLPALLKSFSEQAPQARLRIIPVLVYDAAELFGKHELDCLLIGNPLIKGTHLVETVLTRHEMMCATWKHNEAIAHFTLERYLALDHLQISPDGDEKGVSDRALADMGLTRRVVAVIPHYMVAPKVLKGTNLVAAFADGMVPLLDASSEICVLRPPFPMPDVNLSLVYPRSKQTDAGHIWLRSCIRQVVSVCEEHKRAFLAGIESLQH